MPHHKLAVPLTLPTTLATKPDIKLTPVLIMGCTAEEVKVQLEYDCDALASQGLEGIKNWN
jgi:hypothetical protein